MQRIFFSLLLVLISVMGVNAQILNVEAVRLQEDTTNVWLGAFTGTYTLQSQQTKTLDFSFETNAAHLGQNADYYFIGNMNFLKGNGEQLISNGYLHLRSNIYKIWKISPEIFTQLQYDNVRGLKERYLIGSDARYNLKEGEKFKTSVGLGAMFEHELWQEENEEQGNIGSFRETQFFKIASYLSVNWDISDKLFFNVISYYQVPFERLSQYRLSATGNFNIKLSEHWAFTTSFSYWYENEPIIAIDKVNYTIQNGLTLSF
ncbi:DUF481 domain-containing protein [Sediminitomix flava]|uniref:Uncharacterized protein DUF481 n=1 Tax=Sediminitomix flava TaxID=379075 RepID=A0A315ZIG4_SEDFL|nr:DUF481 domain-containing protein [Sediminitomix flava]PWJ44999.1 uncharacterized protein DUF481 [Sediminitomix flava]